MSPGHLDAVRHAFRVGTAIRLTWSSCSLALTFLSSANEAMNKAGASQVEDSKAEATRVNIPDICHGRWEKN